MDPISGSGQDSTARPVERHREQRRTREIYDSEFYAARSDWRKAVIWAFVGAALCILGGVWLLLSIQSSANDSALPGLSSQLMSLLLPFIVAGLFVPGVLYLIFGILLARRSRIVAGLATVLAGMQTLFALMDIVRGGLSPIAILLTALASWEFWLMLSVFRALGLMRIYEEQQRAKARARLGYPR